MPLTCRARSSIVRMVMGSNFFMGRFIFWFCSGLVPFLREFLRLPNAREMSRRFTIKKPPGSWGAKRDRSLPSPEVAGSSW